MEQDFICSSTSCIKMKQKTDILAKKLKLSIFSKNHQFLYFCVFSKLWTLEVKYPPELLIASLSTDTNT